MTEPNPANSPTNIGIPSLRLMVVDDHEDAAESLAQLLRLHGHIVHVAHQGATALDLVTSFQPHVVFLDIGMPGIDGYETARRMRAVPDLNETVLVALTGWGSQDDRRRILECGFECHLVKPVNLKAVLRLLNKLKQGKFSSEKVT